MRDAIRLKQYSIRTEEAYTNWIKRYIYSHNVCHPAEIGAPELQAFLSQLAVNEHAAVEVPEGDSIPRTQRVSIA